MMPGYQAKFENHNRCVQEDTVDDDHHQDEAEDTRVANDKM